ncbi:carbohydrate porin [Psychromonas ossibalaenae]|uniref:carbohydrate porin n=1 Tax=Psychromonas ossibalaenae TaxID=444922 RepID=UPI00036EFC95|nr:carbohydrate porin [Psychromonas ossibalaenae]
MSSSKLPFYFAALPLLVSGNTVFASTVDFSGYMRAGTGSSQNSGAMVSYEKQKVGRLGNEDDIYTALGAGTELYNSAEQSVYLQTRFIYQSDGANDWESISNEDTNFMIKELNVAVKGIFPSLPEATAWIGKRYNQRHDNHIIDTYFWNVSGTGLGIDYIPLGSGLLSTSAIRSDRAAVADDGTSNGNLNVNIFDIRYKAGLWNNAVFEVGLDYAMPNESSDFTGSVESGQLITGLLTHKFSWGSNSGVFQYGTNGFSEALFNDHAGKSYYAEAESDSSAYRIMNFGLVNISEQFKVAHSVYYTSSINEITAGQHDDKTTFSIVARPQFNWDTQNKTMVELGYFDQTDGHNIDSSGSKVTLAQAWSPAGGFWSRPELRLFVSYLNDQGDQDRFGTGKNSEVNVGAQVEAWW